MSSTTGPEDDGSTQDERVEGIGAYNAAPIDVYAQREPVRRGIPFIVGAVGVPLLAVWALVPVRHHVEDSLKAKAVQALGAAGVSGVNVRMNGRDARLVGTLSDDATRARIHDIVRSRVGIRHVDESGLTVGEVGAGALGSFDFAIAAGRVTITGVLPDDGTGAALRTAAATAFGPDNVEERAQRR